MSTSFTRTREQVAHLVLGDIQQVRSTEADSADMVDVYEAVDLRLKDLHSLGIYWRKVPSTPVSFTVTASTNSASATADILFPIGLTIVSGSLDEPVQIIGAREYAAIENKAETGLPTKALWKGSAEFLFHPVPTASTTAKLTYEKIADDTSAGAAPDVDVAMIRSLVHLVRFDLVDKFSVPDSKIPRWEKQANQAERRIRFLSSERKDYGAVAVDDFDSRNPMDRSRTDYGR